MSNESPAAILFDKLGNPIGVINDGYTYRLQTDTTVSKIVPTISILNSTTTPLAANAMFVGSSEDVSTFVSIDITILSDQNSATNGLLAEWSQDGIVFNYPINFTITANVGQYYSLSPRAKYFRLKFTNGTQDQASLAISTVFYPTNRSVYVQNLDTDVSGQQGVEVVRSVIAAQKTGAPLSDYVNLQANVFGALKVDATATTQTIKITDGYNGLVAVKPPNTAAQSDDSALVVAISPNNPITTTMARPSINTTFSIAASVSNTILISENSLRLGATIYNDSSGFLYIKLGGLASQSDFTVKLFPFCYYEVPYGFTGEIDAIWSTDTGFARCGELTA